jgi:hypothetical protein
MVCIPASRLVGVQANVPCVLVALAVNVAPAGSGLAVRAVIASPSGSPAETVNVRGDPPKAGTLRGAVTTGARSGTPIRMDVVAEPWSVFVAVNVTL